MCDPTLELGKKEGYTVDSSCAEVLAQNLDPRPYPNLWEILTLLSFGDSEASLSLRGVLIGLPFSPGCWENPILTSNTPLPSKETR